MTIEEAKSLPQLLQALRDEQVPEVEYKTYVGRFLEFKAREQGIPISCQFELTPLCNLDCKMCYVHLQKEQMRDAKLLDVEAWKDLMRQSVECGMISADLTGGECLTYPGFDELYLYLRELGVEVSVKTNGILLDEKRIAFFKKYCPSEIQVSLYGASEEAYERVTGVRCFERVRRNLLAAKEAGLPIHIAITPNRFMTDGKEILRLTQEMGFPSYTINACLFAPREETGRQGQSLDMTTEGYIELFRFSRSLRGKESIPVAARDLPDIQSNRTESRRGLRCGAGRSGFDINWRGEMFPCSNLYDQVAYPLQVGVKQAWEQVHQIALDYPMPMECDGCAIYEKCIRCPAAHQNAPKGHADTQYCRHGLALVEAGVM